MVRQERTEAEDVCLALAALLITKDAEPGNILIVEQHIPASLYDRLLKAARIDDRVAELTATQPVAPHPSFSDQDDPRTNPHPL